MSNVIDKIKETFKQFGPTTWSVRNKTTIYLIILIVSAIGLTQFMTLPKEQFPDIVVPTVSVQTIYVGNSPKDIENLVTRPIEKQLKGLSGVKVKKVTSTSLQDFSLVIVEFETSVKTDIALQKVKDAVDKSKKDLPQNLTAPPTVQEVAFSEFPIMYVNVSGSYDLVKLKQYADRMKDRLEELREITRVELVGAPEREIQVNVDNFAMSNAGVTFNDIENAISRENADISGGLIEVGNMKRSLRVKGQFKSAFDFNNLVIKNIYGSPVYLRDIAKVIDTVKEKESYARLNGKNVITLNIIKRSGENLINASEKLNAVVADLRKTEFPKDLDIVITADQSKNTRTSFNELVNSIVIGFVLVLLVLMFFMGVTNAFFVALSVPLSMFVAFLFLPAAEPIIGTSLTLNFIVLFALLFGLGIIVDDAIVVIENAHRIYDNGSMPIERATRMAAGEVWIPVLAGTATTLAPFIPLLFWPGLIGKFMIYLPTMLLFTLTASLIVAFIMNPVFAVDFMGHTDHDKKEPKTAIFKKPLFWLALVVGVVMNIAGGAAEAASSKLALHFTGNILIFFVLLAVLNRFVLDGLIHGFQNRALPWIMNHYETLLRWALKGWRPVYLLLSTFLVLIASFMFFGMRNVPVVFFPDGDPNFIYVYLRLPVGTDVKYTDSVTHVLEGKVAKVLGIDQGKTNPVVESIISNVAVGAGDPQQQDRSVQSQLGRIQVSFVEFEKRHGKSTRPYLDAIRNEVRDVAGAEITVGKENGGPPTQPPVNVEVSSENFDNLTKTAVALKNYLDTVKVAGIEQLKMDVDLTNPEVTVTVDRERAMMEGVSTGQIGMEIRTALFGSEASKLKDEEEEYKIQIRNNAVQRKSLNDLMNMRVTFRDFTNGQVKQIPISAVAKVEFTNTYGSIKRKNLKRVIALSSNVLNGFTPTEVNVELEKVLEDFRFKYLPDDVTLAQTGEGEEQAETGAFLFKALLIALALILLILVLQFNSISKSVIILTEIIFSVIGVLLGFGITRMEVSVVMTGIGIVGLAGIVVKNGILVIEFADELRGRGMKTREAIVQAGKTRIIPVLLTALAAILGLIPLATGFNIDFVRMFSELNPNIFFGGDSAVFWKPLSWTIIYGLAFAFFMTLVIVPAMYLIAERLRRPMKRVFGEWVKFLGVPPFTLVMMLLMLGAWFIHWVKVRRRRRRLGKSASETHIGSWF
jgi:multidrug efflux pump